mgnify:CR=1 FL=1
MLVHFKCAIDFGEPAVIGWRRFNGIVGENFGSENVEVAGKVPPGRDGVPADQFQSAHIAGAGIDKGIDQHHGICNGIDLFGLIPGNGVGGGFIINGSQKIFVFGVCVGIIQSVGICELGFGICISPVQVERLG